VEIKEKDELQKASKRDMIFLKKNFIKKPQVNLLENILT